MSSIRLPGNMKILVGVLRKLLEEKREQSVHILASSDSIADRASAVGVARVDRLIEEDYGSVRVPRMWVVDGVQLIVDRSRAELEEKTRQ